MAHMFVEQLANICARQTDMMHRANLRDAFLWSRRLPSGRCLSQANGCPWRQQSETAELPTLGEVWRDPSMREHGL